MQGLGDAEAAVPVVARETALGRLWYRPDKAFQTPKAVVYLDIESPAAYSSPEASVLTRIFTKLLNDSLNELAYPADLAGGLAAAEHAPSLLRVVAVIFPFMSALLRS